MKITYLDPNDKILGSTEVQDGRVVATGIGRIAEHLVVLDPADPNKRLFPRDGDRWLEALRYEFRSAYVRAVIAEPTQESFVPSQFSDLREGADDCGHVRCPSEVGGSSLAMDREALIKATAAKLGMPEGRARIEAEWIDQMEGDGAFEKLAREILESEQNHKRPLQ